MTEVGVGVLHWEGVGRAFAGGEGWVWESDL